MPLLSQLLDPELIERLDGLALSARSVVRGSVAGSYRSPVRGASVEFRQHRAYAPGDELRRLDWRILGRTDRTYVREYDEETNLRALLLLDVSGSMGYGRRHHKLEFARRFCAALAYLALAGGESVGLASFAERLTGYLPPHSGSTQLAVLLDALERLHPTGTSNLDASAAQLVERLDRRALVVVVGDLLCPLGQFARAMARLGHERHEVVVVRVLHRDEIEFPFRQWARFAGLERETPVLLEASAVRGHYLRSFAAHARGLHEVARGRSASLLTARSDGDLFDLVSSVVRRRTVVGERP